MKMLKSTRRDTSVTLTTSRKTGDQVTPCHIACLAHAYVAKIVVAAPLSRDSRQMGFSNRISKDQAVPRFFFPQRFLFMNLKKGDIT